MIKKCFIDTETTGLNERGLDEVHQIACIITDEDVKPLDWINIKFSPSKEALDQMSPELFEKFNITKESISNRKLSRVDGWNEFTEFLCKHVDRFNKEDKMHFVAYNAPFDRKFVAKLFKQNDDNYFGSYFWNPPICVYQRCAWVLQNKRDHFDHMGLSTMCKFAEIDFDKDAAHDALYDTKKTVELYKAVA